MLNFKTLFQYKIPNINSYIRAITERHPILVIVRLYQNKQRNNLFYDLFIE